MFILKMDEWNLAPKDTRILAEGINPESLRYCREFAAAEKS
jgi:hypothetical protein